MSTALEIAQARVAKIREDRQAKAQDNRSAFPFAARMVDELREFFPGARVTYAQEGGREVGKPMQER